MRFLFLITHYEPVVYGAELFAKRLAEYLVTQGHQVDLVTGRWEDSWDAFQVINGVNVYRVRSPRIRYIQTLAFIVPQVIKARKLINTQDYDFIHAHIFPSLVTPVFLSTKAKKVVTIQGGDLGDYPETYGKLGGVFGSLIGQCLNRADVVHAVSTDLKRQISNLSRKSAIVLPNGADEIVAQTESKLPRKLSRLLPKTKQIIFSSSRLTPKNNLISLVEAVIKLRSQGKDIGLIIAGQGYQQGQIENLIISHGQEKYIRLLGHLKHEEVLTLTGHADVFARVSLQEGFGISVLEAMAVGTPVVASRAGGLADFVTDKTAFVAKGFDPLTIQKAIEMALSQARNNPKSKAAQEQFLARYTWKRILPEFVSKVYRLNLVESN